LLLYINIPNIIILYLFNTLVPEPYMDEYFHYNQFLQYSHNNFKHWDPKITTPPGLYILQRMFAIAVPS
jgi:alpha-1,2-glucosyltransferase